MNSIANNLKFIKSISSIQQLHSFNNDDDDDMPYISMFEMVLHLFEKNIT